MTLRSLRFVLLLAPALLCGQNEGKETTMIFPNPGYTEVKQYLNLTDAQVQSLQTILNNRNQAGQAIYTQISEKHRTLYQLLSSETGTAAQLGQLLIDIRNLEKQLPLNDTPFKAQAQNVLTAEQKAKLPKLIEALQLQSTASQAGMLLLIDFLVFGPPRIMPAGDSVSGAGFGWLPPASPAMVPGARLPLPVNR